MSAPTRPPITPRGEEKVFFDRLREHKLVFQRCAGCSHAVFPLRTVCPHCFGESLDLERAAGTGTVYSFTAQARASHPFFAADVPYTLVLVDLDEGVRVFANLVDCPPDDVSVGMPVEAVFDDVEPELTLLRFRPVSIEEQS
ncbi:Zn-ribbon domain-containing OB-fold protein [Microcella sp.]|uniref:Zn-ribbon domain-containing OB-fold protein n=1 Tax=Microcella sp. TaxID=1913979 RepID=UPI0025655AB7|nr:Zn-ribbon domain-containing OB-fold protein [Microcella sp.]MBX9472542.1 Zn-ribbon domain-containing OB-fold protein [Microcella sp.]